ncbi:Sec-independent protein translocase subunit TatA/TatB [Halomarina litorea]|uniref:Sec-independent protein translocase subunit TatA/TatB n=1 Tax=Halomarina litorea TaxID=2961595 RepID=UPI0020C2F7E4|nr:twin-arginine translocase TatA/TatE family subunit [Halomarina sp. BCD28]
MYQPVPLFPGMPGGIEMFVVLLVVVLLFGANKLPKLARSSGQAMGEFKKGREEVDRELDAMRESASPTDDAPDDEGAASAARESATN